MIDPKPLQAAGLATSKSARLWRVWTNVNMYNSYPTSSVKERIDCLEIIMVQLIKYFTHKPPAENKKRPGRLGALLSLIAEVLKEANGIGVKLLYTTPDLRKVNDDHQNMCLWLERVDDKHHQGSLLSGFYEEWCSSGHAKTNLSFWEFFAKDKTYYNTPDAMLTLLKDSSEREPHKMFWSGSEWQTNLGVAVDTGSHQSVDSHGHLVDGVIYAANFDGDIFLHNVNESTWNHSVFLAGGPVLAAGLILVKNGHIRKLTPDSGHYRPGPENMLRLVTVLGAKIKDEAAIRAEFGGPYYKVGDFRKHGPRNVPKSCELSSAAVQTILTKAVL